MNIADTPRRQLGELGALAQKTEADERRILDAAEKRLTQVVGEIQKAGQAILIGDAERDDEYMALVEERGRLEQVIAQARAALAPGD